MLPKIVDKIIEKEHGNTVYAEDTKNRILHFIKSKYFTKSSSSSQKSKEHKKPVISKHKKK